MRITETRHYFGPSARARKSAICHRLDLGDLPAAGAPLAGMRDLPRLLEYLPELADDEAHWVGPADSRTARRIARLFGRIVLALQRRAGHRVAFASTFRAPRRQVYDVVHDFEVRDVGAAAALLSLATLIDTLPDGLVPAGVRDPSFDFDAALQAFLAYAGAHPMHGPLLDLSRRARRRGIFVQELSRVGVVQLGQGHRRRRIGSAMIADAPDLWRDFLARRDGLYTFLHEYGVAVPRWRVAEDAAEIGGLADAIGYPIELVIGSDAGGDRRTIRLADAAALDAWRAGADAAKGPLVVVADRDDGARHEFAVGAELSIIRGGQPTPVPADLHPGYATLARRALEAVGLRGGTVVIGTADLARSPIATGATVRSIAPAAEDAAAPRSARHEESADVLLDALFPHAGASRIPVACITGSNGKTTTTYLTSHIVRTAGRVTGVATTYGAEIAGALIEKGDLAGAHTALIVLQSPQVEAAILETAYGGISKFGLGPGECSVGAVINVTTDHVGKGALKTVEDLATHKSVVVRHARDAAILNADDPHSLAMREATPAKVVCLVSRQPHNAAIEAHEKAGGATARLIEDGAEAWLALFDGRQRLRLCRVDEVPITFGGRAEHNVENALFAAGIAFHLGIEPAAIAAGLKSFESTYEQLPGRVNFFKGLPFDVMMDYAHNIEGMETITRFIDRLDVAARKSCVLTSPGNRPDAQIVSLGRIAGAHFDRFYLCPEDDLRGRQPHEVPDFLRRGLLEAGVAEEHIVLVPREEEAIARALAAGEPGDLVTLFIADLDRARAQIEADVRRRGALIGSGGANAEARDAAVSA
jgi:UDP-N-acetylmuramyl tripeptide synthase